MKIAFLIPADKSHPICPVDVDGLESLQKAVGGYIEMVPHDHPERATIYCNEEGKLEGLPFNGRATIFWGSLLERELSDVLLGDVIVLGPTDQDGDETNVTEAIEKFMTVLSDEQV